MRKVLKGLAGFVLLRCGVARLLFLLHRLVKGRSVLVVLTYHRVIDGRRTARFYTAYDRGLDVDLFRLQIQQLRRYFTFVGLDEFIAILSGRQAPRGPSALLTFDDADSDFFSYAYPILSTNEVRAVVMTPSGLVESEDKLWHVRMSNLIMSLTEEQWATICDRRQEWPQPVIEVLDDCAIGNEAERRETCLTLNRALDQLRHREVDRMIDAWEDLIQPHPHLDIHCMTWEELRYLEEHDIDIESHTNSHLKLTMLDEDQLARELVDSKRIIESKLGKTVRAVAYPQGHYDEDIAKAAREAGYEAGFTTVPGPCRYPLSGDDLFQIPRMDVLGKTPQEVTLYLARICINSMAQT